MDNIPKAEHKEETLNDSWVELHFRSGGSTPRTVGIPIDQDVPSFLQHGQMGIPIDQDVPSFLQHGQMEKLLLEAQRESSQSSHSGGSSNRASPKSPHSPTNEIAPETLKSLQLQEGQVLEKLQTSDWIWDWSSRPEVIPPADMAKQYQHKKRNLSVRNSKVMKTGLFSMENLPTLIFTHACTFIMGAAVMFIYLKKYCKWTGLAIQPVD